ncbi:LPS export ABC transporter periplasmic protein LptC [Pseudomonas nicosulfuronedens]|uniref:Lipopolysaccharide export system protein LptC n=1 Tax=Pseudomonas nicosulfuronedens TaxID=2571105 RepID=A0A5R9R897_9PSED|nr:LPS export ABC transporter periplasmic protein LptC [Pseudomonas nicosulfuronedens]MDH1007724.1 LPS export ABC transporter periplasmic protein LptC [Pseudomonas nicosulfuronedens]MDH1977769.1 LPS export ABC transporter periplasmic protein LptC [Pseudomonas nicosulfuronedens]MDH2025632.1 LPS export ABC transporter periplasmic protein LptC [Pseudomonas nicosulfuronedens]TLX79169.1 LPS export ABC transporter periplasmic protein LptC [Pseudomonas nicosulfuronedens]
MPKTFQQKLLLALIAILLIALGYYWNVRLDFNERQLKSQTSDAVDFYVVNAKSVQYRVDGSLAYEMTADKLEHLKASDVTLVTTPDLYFHRENEPQPWHVQSVRAEVAPEGKQVELIDDVRVARTDAQQRTLLLNTSRMTVFPDKDYAQTDQPVKITEPNGVTTAVGMKAYLKDSRMLLLSNVRGQHEAR